MYLSICLLKKYYFCISAQFTFLWFGDEVHALEFILHDYSADSIKIKYSSIKIRKKFTIMHLKKCMVYVIVLPNSAKFTIQLCMIKICFNFKIHLFTQI